MTGMPQDPIGQSTQAAIQLHEMFLAYIAAGFSRKEALSIVSAMVAAMVAKGMPS